MPNAYMISTSLRDRPDTGGDPSVMVNDNVSLHAAVTSLVQQINRHHLRPGTVDKLIIAGDQKKGTVLIGTGLTVSTAKSLAPVAPFLIQGLSHVGVELAGFKINNDVGNRDLADAIAQALKTTVTAGGESFAPRKA